jgi:hypothetical protein
VFIHLVLCSILTFASVNFLHAVDPLPFFNTSHSHQSNLSAKNQPDKSNLDIDYASDDDDNDADFREDEVKSKSLFKKTKNKITAFLRWCKKHYLVTGTVFVLCGGSVTYHFSNTAPETVSPPTRSVTGVDNKLVIDSTNVLPQEKTPEELIVNANSPANTLQDSSTKDPYYKVKAIGFGAFCTSLFVLLLYGGVFG